MIGRNCSLHMLTLFQGFGLLAPCLSLSVGKTCCFPSSAVIPAVESTAELLKVTRARSLMTVPIILEEFATSPNQTYNDLLIPLDFVAIGGGALKPLVGEVLAGKGVKLLNHYGATEIGAIAYICVPDNTYDWRYLRLRTDLRLELNEIGENGFSRLTGFPFGWQNPFEIQDQLERNPSSAQWEVRVLGRTDDLIVLATGEKVLPRLIEEGLSQIESIQTVICFGEHRSEVGVLVEPKDAFASRGHRWIIDSIWPIVQDINQILDGHARISSQDSILIKPADKRIPRSDKGSIMRKEVYKTFSVEIDAVYQRLEESSPHLDYPILNREDLETSLKAIVQISFQNRVPYASWSVTDDFFELGMDSLEATRLSRYLGAAADKEDFPGIARGIAKPDFIYRHPTVTRLAEAMKGSVNATLSDVTRIREMRLLRDRYCCATDGIEAARIQTTTTVILTGSTGTLGSHILAGLARNKGIKHIFCINRRPRTHTNGFLSHLDPKNRQVSANNRQGLVIDQDLWAKIDFLEMETQSKYLGLEHGVYEGLAGQVTHILHNAWPMNFQRTLESFESQVRVVYNLLDLAKRAHHLQQKVRPKVLFLSSIAVAGRYPGKVVIEAPVEDPSSTVPMGYAEAKWVCEQIILDVARVNPAQIEPIIVRVGQLTGSSIIGCWNSNEHLPSLIKASQMIGALPDMRGVRRSVTLRSYATSNRITEPLMASCGPSFERRSRNPLSRKPWEHVLSR